MTAGGGCARAWSGTALRLVLGAVLFVAGALKVTDLAGSVRAVGAYQLMPYEAAETAGAVLPFLEITVGILLLAGLATRFAAAVSALLLTAFTAGIISAWARGLSIDCGCFGGGGALAAGQSPQYGWELPRDGLLLAVAVVLVVWPRTAVSADGWLARVAAEAEPTAARPASDAETG
ncbi:DoxX family protein [Catellatospora bangladeshensis]|uniref:Methylamine utilisation protein MauE domain-containing protein n=1 Tax=Catellatospora bangladeshensis TaxID=310355 RepID=A0A8J3JMM7_9ACTN|nr:DoxX family protein [Catellatospora bangladeshensis]GIF83461.1 hypothetical protein Cba03nite_48100 [Catellatospora bangladeshensis]